MTVQQIGFSLIDASNKELKFWGDQIGRLVTPERVIWPNGDITEGFSGPCTHADWRVVPRMAALGKEQPLEFDGKNVVVGFPITPAMIVDERERRLQVGFEFDFGDVRGVHQIGTSVGDMVGWNAVTTLAQAAINLQAPETPINIVTNTGPATVTALEWQSILVAAGQFQQPIWAASFALQAANPIPSDYTNDEHWA